MQGRYIASVFVLAISQWSCASRPAASAVFSDQTAAGIADAAAAGDKARVTRLIDDGGDASAVGRKGTSVLQWSMLNAAILQILLDRSVDLNVANTHSGRTPLMAALMAGREVQFDKLLEAGADVHRADSGGNTALHLAAKMDNFQKASTLLHAGADPLALNARGFTFQRYLFMTPTNVLSADAVATRDTLITWLREHDVRLESVQP